MGTWAITTRKNSYRDREPSLISVVREGFLKEDLSNLRPEGLMGFNQAEIKGRIE